MKYLAIETEVEGVNWDNCDLLLKEEAKTALRFFERGLFREMYFDEENCAVLILECSSKEEARQALEQLPLVKAGMIEFEIKELKPYNGFSRLLE
jgi:hypothetical protein